MIHSICKRAVDFSCCRQLFGGVRVDKLVVIINGSGGVGKDTVCDAAAAFWKTRNISSITPILRVAESAGWDGVKTPASRRFLSELKQSCTEFNDLPFRYCTEQLAAFRESDEQLMFVHIREPRRSPASARPQGRTAARFSSPAPPWSRRAVRSAIVRTTAFRSMRMTAFSSTTARWTSCRTRYIVSSRTG